MGLPMELVVCAQEALWLELSSSSLKRLYIPLRSCQVQLYCPPLKGDQQVIDTVRVCGLDKEYMVIGSKRVCCLLTDLAC